MAPQVAAQTPVAVQSDASGPGVESIVVRVAGVDAKLLPPTLDGTLGPSEQETRIVRELRGLSFRQFSRDSVVAPVRIHLSYLKDEQGKRLGHSVHLLFIIHQPLKNFSEKAMERWFAETQGGAPEAATGQNEDFEFEQVDSATLQSWGLEQKSGEIAFRQFKFDLLEKVRLEGAAKIERHSTAKQNRIDLSLVEQADNRWAKLPEVADRFSYAGMRGWLTATELAGMDAVLVESRFILHEPEGWFTGANFLRSKLPLVLQEAARTLRRRMKSSDSD